MSTVIEARRLNGTDLGKTISFPGTEGTLRGVVHGFITEEGPAPSKRYVTAIVGKESHVLEPSDKITITGRMKKPEVQS
ncbi:hypothetical protein [Glutamicibacter nicotianae]|uniref:hypothetical protein n=1 Tax=Glutamicibacter nicotianae TaxID=37929 RepID=UPI002556F48D|nr:hypothetical protein [Glutamicibacter nicotianae]WIV42569.1 hypothetical protein QQS42_09515 [Glutamicibacter nicotianae]